MRKVLAAVLALQLAVAPTSAGDVFVVDGTRSEAKFEIRYLLSTVAGRLRDISGVIDLDPGNPIASTVTFSMKTGSVDTGSVELDQLLRSANFLNVARFPEITFKSASIRNTAKTNVYQVIGDLSLHGVTKRIMLSVEVSGIVREGAGDAPARATFKVRTSLNRKDYGINWNTVLDHGSLLVGDEIEVTINLDASRQAPIRR